MDWEPLYDGMGKSASSAVTNDFGGGDFSSSVPDDLTLYADTKDTFEKSTQHYQYKGKYIMTAVKSGLMIIDQHRAHIRVLYDRYRKQMEGSNGQSQGLLFPEMLQLPPSEGIVLDAVPSGTEGLNPVEMVRGIVHSSIEKGCNVEEDVRHYIALSLARSAAIVQGQVLSNEEMEALVDDLFVCRNPNQTPDGKVVVAILEQDDLDQLFG